MRHQYLPAVAVFVAGLLTVLIAAGLLVLNVIESGPAAMVGIVGISLIGGSGGLAAVAAGRRRDRP
jgi:hypothetical protein